MSTTNIEWTDKVWNPTTGCRKVSPGCQHCYAEGVAHRFWHHQYVHTAERGFIPVKAYAGDQMTGTLRRFTDLMTHADRLLEPLSWRKPAFVFVNSMSDLFHEDVPDAFIDKVFAIMALAPWHTFQVLTKRPERMLRWASHPSRLESLDVALIDVCNSADRSCQTFQQSAPNPSNWPLPNVWLGVSVEDQPRAAARIPLLLQTPAAVRFISAEPLLGPVDLRGAEPTFYGAYLDWVIVGGESGSGARPCEVSWVGSIVRQCQASGVPVFVKQLGADPRDAAAERDDMCARETWPAGWMPEIGGRRVWRPDLTDRKGGDMAEWPEDLRVREFPR